MVGIQNATWEASAMQIIKSKIDALAPTARTQRYWDDKLKGFGVSVSPNGSKSSA
jgi:hypothetical protein